MAYIGILGYGTVGRGVVELINKNRFKFKNSINEELILSKILVKNLDKHKSDNSLEMLTKNVEDVFNEKVDIIIEAMGGTKPSYEYVKRALQLKKHVVTANKDLIAEHGAELLNIAKENGVILRFEASVGGGIPILKPLSECLIGNKIKSIKAILNGTTNFILSKMSKENMSYEDALKQAQALGFAEANPESDVMGYDAARKLSILSTIAFEQRIHWKSMNIIGITDIDEEDFKYAERQGLDIKLVALSELQKEKVYASVAPVMVKKNSSLSRIENEYNAIFVEGDAVGDIVFTGKGAGMFPTASAVFSDLVDIIKNRNEDFLSFDYKEALINTLLDRESKWLLRVNTKDRVKTIEGIGTLFSNCNILGKGLSQKEEEVASFVKADNEAILNKNIDKLKEDFGADNVKKIRVLEE